MSIENYICESCLCFNVCDVRKKLVKFHEEAKTPLPTDIRILNCEDYLGAKEEDKED
jgi:hypothetical protein